MDPGFRNMLEVEAVEAAQTPRPAPGTLPPAIAREGYRLRRQAQNPSPPQEVVVKDLTIDLDDRGLKARLYKPDGVRDPSALLVYFHGGGFIVGDLDSHDGHCRRLAVGSGVQVLAVDYRLAPEHPFPAAHDDALDAVLWAFDNCTQFNVDRERIAVGGDSAGANLAASVACDLADDPGHKLAFHLLLYPVVWPDEETETRRKHDGLVLSRTGFAWFNKCLGLDEDAIPARLKIFQRGTSTPGLIVTAGFDPLRDEGKMLHDIRLKQGVPSIYLDFPDLIHDFFVMPSISSRVEEVTNQVTQLISDTLYDNT